MKIIWNLKLKFSVYKLDFICLFIYLLAVLVMEFKALFMTGKFYNIFHAAY